MIVLTGNQVDVCSRQDKQKLSYHGHFSSTSFYKDIFSFEISPSTSNGEVWRMLHLGGISSLSNANQCVFMEVPIIDFWQIWVLPLSGLIGMVRRS